MISHILLFNKLLQNKVKIAKRQAEFNGLLDKIGYCTARKKAPITLGWYFKLVVLCHDL